jgi:hypothetical protein
MKHIKKFNENSKNNEIKVTLDSYKIVEIMEYSDGYVYGRVESSDEFGLNIDWYEEDCISMEGEELFRKDEELNNELEEAYQNSKQGYKETFNK